MVASRNYYLQRSTNLISSPAFTTIWTNFFPFLINGQYTYTDTKATNGGPYFYRVGVAQLW